VREASVFDINIECDIMLFVDFSMSESTSFESALHTEGAMLQDAKSLRDSRFARAGVMWKRKAVRALVDAVVIFLPTAIGATVGFVPGAFLGGWIGSEILKRKEGLSTKRTSEKIRDGKFSESARLFGQKTSRALIDAVVATFPPMLGALLGNVIPGPGALGGALIGSWISAQLLKKTHQKRAKV
jgi:hypothetical protein